jgi:hypothetical protein
MQNAQATTDDREQLTAVCAALGIRIESKQSNVAPLGWGPGSTHWAVTLRMGRRSIRTPFHMGSACKGEPTAADVLSSLLIDASAGAQSFDDHCAEFGLSRDSRAEYATWKVCRAMAPRVLRFLGDAFDRALAAEH